MSKTNSYVKHAACIPRHLAMRPADSIPNDNSREITGAFDLGSDGGVKRLACDMKWGKTLLCLKQLTDQYPRNESIDKGDETRISPPRVWIEDESQKNWITPCQREHGPLL